MLPTHMQLMRHPLTCALTNSIQQPVHSAPSVFPQKSAGGTSLYAQSKSQMDRRQRIF